MLTLGSLTLPARSLLRCSAQPQGDARRERKKLTPTPRNFLRSQRKKKLLGSSTGDVSSSAASPESPNGQPGPKNPRPSDPTPTPLPIPSELPSPPKPIAALPSPEQSSLGGEPGSPAPAQQYPCSPASEALKLKIIRVVASLDRGLAATRRVAEDVDGLVRQLETTWARIDLKENSSPLSGRWRLVYSSAFGSGSLGGSRPGPPTAFQPFTLGQIYQRIQVGQANLDNIVELIFGPPSLPLPGLSAPLEPIILQLSLGHAFAMTGPQTTRITFDKTTVRTRGPGFLRQIPPLQTPELPEFLRPPSALRSASFDTSYVDGDFRVSRGDRGELRIYVRADA